VLARAARLSLSGRAVLDAAAVLGPRVEPALLAEVTRAEGQSVSEGLDVGMLRGQGHTLAFRHELARQAILESIAPHRRIFLHQAALDALEAAGGARKELARLAHHAHAAGNRRAVLQYAPAAARQAVQASTHRAAAELYALALRYADELPAAEQAQLFAEYSVERDVIGQRNRAIGARKKAADLWREAGDVRKCGEALSDLALLHHLVGQLAEADRVNREALDLLEALSPGRELLKAYNMQALLALANQDGAAGVALAEKAVELAQRLEATADLPRLYETLGLCWLYLDTTRGCEFLEQSLAYARDLGHAVRAANTYANLSSIYVEFHQFQRAEQYFDEGIPYAAERDLDFAVLYMQGWQAIMLVQQGQWNAAEELAQELLRRPAPSPGRGPALMALGRLQTRLGDPQARATLDEALELLLKLGYRQREGLIRVARAEGAWLAGDHQRALDEVHAVDDIVARIRHPWAGGELAFWQQRAGEALSAPPWVARPWAQHLAGDWRAAAAAWEQLGCPYEQALALYDGDGEAQKAALLIFERLGARPMAELARQKMQEAGVQTIPRGPRAATRENPFGLTNRQLQVLRLLVEELTNAQIAARLYISPKTVDHHVSAVLAQLQVSSREEAAALAREHPQF